MKTTVKIIILVLAVSLAIGGVMVFIKTKVAPPTPAKYVDQYIIDHNKSIGKITRDKGDEINNLFDISLYKLQVFLSENKITEKEAVNQTDKLVKTYVPLFATNSYSKFYKPVWYAEDHNFILSRISELRQMKHTNGNSLLNNENKKLLSDIEGVIKKYRHAQAVANDCSYRGLNQARSSIAEAKKLANDIYLQNCTELVNNLHSVKSRIHDSHFATLKYQVSRLREYNTMTIEYYMNTLVPYVDHLLSEYRDNASSIYGTKNSIAPLNEDANIYVKAAMSYYDDGWSGL